MIRAILIDPHARTITEIELKPDQVLDGLYQHIQCDCVDVVGVGSHDLWVDDEGLMKDGVELFGIEETPQPYAGRGVLTCTDREGETTSATWSLEEVVSLISWVDMIYTIGDRTVVSVTPARDLVN